jgi:hypothetical protein
MKINLPVYPSEALRLALQFSAKAAIQNQNDQTEMTPLNLMPYFVCWKEFLV